MWKVGRRHPKAPEEASSAVQTTSQMPALPQVGCVGSRLSPRSTRALAHTYSLSTGIPGATGDNAEPLSSWGSGSAGEDTEWRLTPGCDEGAFTL